MARALARARRRSRTIAHVGLPHGLTKISLTLGTPSFSAASFVYDEKDLELTIALRSKARPSPHSLMTLISLWTPFTWAVERAIDTALFAASRVLTLPLSHTTPYLSVST
jgi:hypothetical protein